MNFKLHYVVTLFKIDILSPLNILNHVTCELNLLGSCKYLMLKRLFWL